MFLIFYFVKWICFKNIIILIVGCIFNFNIILNILIVFCYFVIVFRIDSRVIESKLFEFFVLVDII